MGVVQYPTGNVRLTLLETEDVTFKAGMTITGLGRNPLELGGSARDGSLEDPNLSPGGVHVDAKVSGRWVVADSTRVSDALLLNSPVPAEVLVFSIDLLASFAIVRHQIRAPEAEMPEELTRIRASSASLAQSGLLIRNQCYLRPHLDPRPAPSCALNWRPWHGDRYGDQRRDKAAFAKGRVVQRNGGQVERCVDAKGGLGSRGG